MIVPWFAPVPAPGALYSVKVLAASRNALEAVKHVVVVMEGSHDRPLRIDVEAAGALVEACASARSTK